MKILVVSAHPDDAEIACAGTLRRYQQQGAEIISVVAVQPSTEVNSKRTTAIVTNELNSSYALSGWNLRIFPTPLHAGGRPNLVVNNVNMTHLHDLLEACDIAIIPNPEDSHQDHRATYELAWPYVKKYARQTWLMHSWPYCHDYNHAANHYVGIADQWQFKRQLLECYSSYLSAEDVDHIYTANQYWAQRNRQLLAECFTIVNSYE
jgi:LmbE family N-acetylglucosaminyl deacetylase